MKVSSSVQPDHHEPRSHGGTEHTRSLRVSVSPWPVAVIAAVYLVAHLPFLAPSLEDIDSMNFALGLRHFDPAQHQPHPPGYPVYMVLGHISLPITERLTAA